jgi:hypothetical protein
VVNSKALKAKAGLGATGAAPEAGAPKAGPEAAAPKARPGAETGAGAPKAGPEAATAGKSWYLRRTSPEQRRMSRHEPPDVVL